MTLNATTDQFAAENTFYRLAPPHRIGKFLAQYEAFRMTLDVPGAIVECGVFKGSSFYRFASLRALFNSPWAKRLIGFDTFDDYCSIDPEFSADTIEDRRDAQLLAAILIDAGQRCATTDEVMEALRAKHCDQNVDLIAGQVQQTIPYYVERNPELKISLLNLDLDFYGGTKVVLEHLWPRVSHGGIMLLDNYGVFAGETRAVDELGLSPRKYPFCYSPSFVVKP